MTTFTIGETTYRHRRLSAYEQWGLYRLVVPIIPTLTGVEFGMRAPTFQLADLTTIFAPLRAMRNGEIDAVFAAAKAACQKNDGEAWVPVTSIRKMADLFSFVMEVVSYNFGALFAMKRPDFRPTPFEHGYFTPVTMPDGEDYLFRPVVRGMCPGLALFDGTLRIEQIAKFNDALDVQDENERRARKAAEKK